MGIFDNWETITSDSIILSEYPVSIALDEEDHKAYVLTLNVDTFSIIVLENNQIIDELQFDRDFGEPNIVQIDPKNKLLYVASYREPSVSVYDIEAKSLIQNIDLRYCPNSSIQKFYFNQKTNTLYFLVHGTQKENPRGCDSGGYSTIRILNGSNFEIIPKLTNSTNVHSLLFNS